MGRAGGLRTTQLRVDVRSARSEKCGYIAGSCGIQRYNESGVRWMADDTQAYPQVQWKSVLRHIESAKLIRMLRRLHAAFLVSGRQTVGRAAGGRAGT
jgi:hypothetical protein